MFRQQKLKLIAGGLAALAVVGVFMGGLGERDTVSAQDRGEPPPLGALHTVLDGFVAGFGAETTADGDVLVVDIGSGKDDGRVLRGSDANEDGQLTPDEFTVELDGLWSVGEGEEVLGISEAIEGSDGTIWGVTGGIADDLPGSASLWNLTNKVQVADFWAVESSDDPKVGNPDGTDLNSNPFSLVEEADGDILVVDAGANVIWHVETTVEGAARGQLPVTVWAIVPSPNEGQNQPVPTGNELGPDGALYFTILGSEVNGIAQVLRAEDVDLDGDALEEGEITVVADGLTGATDVTFDAEGHYIVSQFTNDWSAPEAPGSLLISAETVPAEGAARGLVYSPLVDYAVTPTGVAVAGDDIYAVELFWGFVVGSFGSRVSVVGDLNWQLLVSDQELREGESTIVIDVVTMVEPGYVVIHEGGHDGFGGTILGNSDYLLPGTYFGLEIELTPPPTDGQVVWPMLHTENTGNETYDGADMDLPVVDEVAGNPDFGGVVVFPIMLTVTPPPTPGVLEPVLDSLGGPFRGVETEFDGSVIVSYQGTGNNDGAVYRGEDANEDGVVSGDEFETLVDGLPSAGEEEIAGPNDAVIGKDGTVYGITGELGGSPADGVFSSVWNFTTGELIADLKAYEELNNTDGFEVEGEPELNSNPYAMEWLDPEAGLLVVSDSGANAVLVVDINTGEVTPGTVFPLVQTDPFPIQTVPTGLEWTPDFEFLLVSFLTGGPYPQGQAGVYALTDNDGDGVAMSEGEQILVATGLTMATDVFVDDQGHLNVTQFTLDPAAKESPGMVSRSAQPLLAARGVEPISEWDDLVTFAVTPTGLTSADDRIYVNEEFLFHISVIAEGEEPIQFDLFEGWNPIDDWPGPELEGDGITEYFDTNVDGEWEALAYYNTETEMWEQRFQDPPLPSFNTLNVIEPGNDIWIFVPTDATLTISPDGGGGGVQTLEISAEGLAFSTDVLTAEPGEIEVEFTNNAGFPHNFSVYHDEAHTDLLAAGQIIDDGTELVELGELAAGEYYFRCDVHPAQMQGELIVN